MSLADHEQQQLIDRLRRAAGEPVTFSQLRAHGISQPAIVLSEIELKGHPIKRVYEEGRLIGVRLIEPEEPEQTTRWWRGPLRRRR